MTIAATTRKAGPFTGTGSVYQFEFTFKVFARSEVVVTVSSNDVETVLELDTDYSVSLNGDQDVNPGGTVTLDEALPEGDKLAITSAVPYSQEIALTNKGGFYPTILNEALDKLTAQCQQLQEQNTRTVTVPATSSISPSEYLNEIFDARETAIEKASAAASSASAASTSATNAQTWAEGTDAAVSVLGGTHSAKGWVNLMSPHFTAIEAVCISQTGWRISEFDERKRIMKLFRSQNRFNTENIYYGLINTANDTYESFEIIKQVSEDSVKIAKPLEEEFSVNSPISRIVFGRTDRDGRYVLAVRDNATDLRYLVKYRIGDVDHFQAVDFHQSLDNLLK